MGNGHDDLQVGGGMLTKGKRSCKQHIRAGAQKSFPQGSSMLTSSNSGDVLALRWAALLLYVLPNLDTHSKQLSKVLLLERR